jgi:hypothetical protein
MRKSLIITAALMVSSLFAGTALADDSRGGDRPSLRADRSDGARSYAEKVRERAEINQRAVRPTREVPNRIEQNRPKGDMVDRTGRTPRASKETVARQNQGKALVNRTVAEKRADIQDRSKKHETRTNSGNKRAFTVANDRNANRNNNGPKTIVDIMARKELLKFLGATGVKVNCSQTGTCTADPI